MTTAQAINEIESAFRAIRLKTLILPVIGLVYFFTPGMYMLSGVVLFAQTFAGREIILDSRKREIFKTYLEQACEDDNPALIDYLVARFPGVSMERYADLFYPTLIRDSWKVVQWFIEHGIVTHSEEMEQRIIKKIGTGIDTRIAIKHLRSIALSTKLEAELEPPEDDDEEPAIVKI